jgi:hypothetical protein
MNSLESTGDVLSHPFSEHTLLYVVIPALLLWGIIDCFYGFRFFKISVICIGSLFIGYLAMQISRHYFDPGFATSFGGFSVGMAIGIVFSWLLYRVETFLLGMALGMLFATSFFPHVSELQLGITCLGGLAGGILMLMFMDVMIISVTAVTGALRIVLCIAVYTGAISTAEIYKLMESESMMGVWYQWHLGLRYVLALLVLLLLGFLKQYGHYRKEKSE